MLNNAKRTEKTTTKKHENKEQSETKHETPRSKNQKATQNKNNTKASALEWSKGKGAQTQRPTQHKRKTKRIHVALSQQMTNSLNQSEQKVDDKQKCGQTMTTIIKHNRSTALERSVINYLEA